MVEGIIVIYVLLSTFALIPIGFNMEDTWDEIEDHGFKVKHLLILISFPFTVILLLIIVAVVSILSFVSDVALMSDFMNKTLWKKKQ